MSDKSKADQSRSGLKKLGVSRRELLSFGSYGLTGAALSSLVSASEKNKAPSPHFEPKAKRVIHICLMGGVSVRNLPHTTSFTRISFVALRREPPYLPVLVMGSWYSSVA